MARTNLYNVEYLDEYGQVYETIEECTYKELQFLKRNAKHFHLRIRATNLMNGKSAELDYLPAELYAER